LQASDADAEAPDAEAPDADGASSSALERDDVVHPGLDRAVLLANAPATHDAFVTVPKMTVGKVKASGAENDA
ncbi:MAG: Asp-tRNA(Asn)/Glu-tRNA(Gln) amidotransferase subunit GatC, partial [Acidobacteriota bacterium]